MLVALAMAHDTRLHGSRRDAERVCLVNMNARIYDPGLGRFMSADPVVPIPLYMQSLNRYSYVLNNPLALTDPSGTNPAAAAVALETVTVTGSNPVTAPLAIAIVAVDVALTLAGVDVFDAADLPSRPPGHVSTPTPSNSPTPPQAEAQATRRRLISTRQAAKASKPSPSQAARSLRMKITKAFEYIFPTD
jgi:RHS repeat-associated protein